MTAIGILVQIETHISRFTVLQIDCFVPFSEGYSCHCDDPVSQIQMEMPSVTDGAGTMVVDEVAAKEEGSFVPRTKGFETLEDFIHLPVHVAEFDLCLYIECRHLLLRLDMCCHRFLEPPLELRQVGAVHTESRCKFMSPEIGKQVAAGVDRRIDIKIADRAC